MQKKKDLKVIPLFHRLDRVRTKRGFPEDGVPLGAKGTILEFSAGGWLALVRLDGTRGGIDGETIYLRSADLELQPRESIAGRLTAAASARASR